MDYGLPCDVCGGPTYMHCHVDGVPTTCRDCDDQAREEAEMEARQEHSRMLSEHRYFFSQNEPRKTD
jgi:hypothetical protein